MRKLWRGLPLLLVASCSTVPDAPPPAPRPQPAPRPAPPVVSEDWRDVPLTPGRWAYVADASGSSAMFGRPGGEADFIVRCDRSSRTISFSRAGALAAGANAIGLTTSAGSLSYAAAPVAGAAPRFAASTRGDDPFLDKIAFSRGRFLVTAGGTSRLVLPSWAEVARTIEDCRK